jgi:hypothetical protein
MVTVKGPCFSWTARGQLAKAVVFKRRLTANVVTRYFTPRNPNSAAQQTSRARTTAAVAGWKALSDANKTTWNDYAKSFQRTGYNMYIAAFLAYMRDNGEAQPAAPFLP